MNTCDPDCATDGREEHPIEVIAHTRRDCSYGEPQYTLLTSRLVPAGRSPSETRTVRFPCPKRPHPDPKIRSMRMRLSGHDPGPRSYVRVRIRLRVCAVRGRSSVVFDETLRGGGTTFGKHTRTRRFRQTAGCGRHTFKWRLRDEFFGVGTYRVAATVRDRHSQVSRTVAPRHTTTD